MNAVNNTENKEKTFAPPKINVIVSADRMLAYIRVTLSYKEQPVTAEQIMAAVKLKNIEYGILHDEIVKFCESKNYYNDLTVAKGLPPVKGANGSVEFHFKERVTKKAAERADGTLDYKNLDLIQNVHKGDTLCTVTLPLEGTPGVDIFGNPVKAQKGDMPVIPSGDKVRLSEDSRFVYADADGGITYRNGIINIDEIYTIKGDVGLSTGNINFNGSVMISGNVLEGYSVTAKEDITVRGVVEGAVLNAGGSILIQGGVNGMRKAVITAVQNFTSVFIENANVKCGGDLCSDVILNGDVSAGGSVILDGRKGTVIGGKCRAGEKIVARVIGSNAHIAQDIIIDPRWYELEKSGGAPNEDPVEKKKSLVSKRNGLADFLEKDALLEKRERAELKPDELKKKMLERLGIKSKIKTAIAQIDESIKEIDKFWGARDFKIICFEEAYPGTKITVSNVTMRVDNLIVNQKFCLNEGEITVGAILPNER